MARQGPKNIEEKSIRHLLGRIREDPWHAVEWKGVKHLEVVSTLILLADNAIIDGYRLEAIDYSTIARRLAQKIDNSHLMCRTEACSGSVMRSIGALEFAEEGLHIADSLCDCKLCRSEVSRRRGVCRLYEGKIQHAQRLFEQSLSLLEQEKEPYDETLKNYQMCIAYLSQACAYRLSGQLRQSLSDIQVGVSRINDEMPARVSISAVINIIWLIAADSNRELSSQSMLDVIDRIQSNVAGSRKREMSRIRPFIRWCRGLLYARLGQIKRAERFMDSAISGLIRNQEPKYNIESARADRVLIKSWSRFPSADERSAILKLLEECDRLEGDEALLAEAKESPTPHNVLQWRRSIAASTVPSVSLSEEGEEERNSEMKGEMCDGIVS